MLTDERKCITDFEGTDTSTETIHPDGQNVYQNTASHQTAKAIKTPLSIVRLRTKTSQK